MKKLLLTLIVMLGITAISQAQETKFGVTAGYNNLTEKAKAEGLSFSQSYSGFYVGALAEFNLNEKWSIQPEVLASFVEESTVLYVPVFVKYYVVEKINVQAGVQGTTFLEETPDEINSFGLDLGFGAGYDINEHFFLEARYTFELTNRYAGEVSGLKDKINTFAVGVGYKF